MLLVVTVCIWGGILWRLIRYAGDREASGLEIQKRFQPACPVPENLSLNYRDPFTEFPEAQSKMALKPSHSVALSRQLPAPVAPSFCFSGKIRKGKKDFLLFEYPDGNMQVWEKGDIDGYSVHKISDDSVVVCKSGKDYTLSIK